VRDGITWETYVPGHSKGDPAHLLSLRPDAFFQFWDLSILPVARPRHHVRRHGYVLMAEFWLRRDSPYLLPGALPPAAPPGAEPGPRARRGGAAGASLPVSGAAAAAGR
jgi:hypothetical protein